jgi:hypothetical protein
MLVLVLHFNPMTGPATIQQLCVMAHIASIQVLFLVLVISIVLIMLIVQLVNFLVTMHAQYALMDICVNGVVAAVLDLVL